MYTIEFDFFATNLFTVGALVIIKNDYDYGIRLVLCVS